MSRLTWLLLLALSLPPIDGRPTRAAEVDDYYNVLAPSGADPWVIRHDGRYHLVQSRDGRIEIRRSASLAGLGAGERKVIWTPPPTGPMSHGLWAPELHRLRGRWYLYVAADDGDNRNHRMFVLENPAADPFEGEFSLKGRVFDPAADRWAIDGTVLDLGDRLFFIWSGWEGDENHRQSLYIAPMRDPWTLSGPRVEISRPTHAWETLGGIPSVNEGPQVLIRGRTVNLIYSASGSWTDHYTLGLLRADFDADLLDPKSWRKESEPVFRSTTKVFGPGHGSFVRSPDGAEDWIVYHSAWHRGSGWSRLLRAQPFTWDAEGRPVFGEPADPDVPIRLPGGDPPHDRFEAESILVGSGPIGARPGASLGAAVASRERLEFEVIAPTSGVFNLALRFGSEAHRKTADARLWSVNGDDPEPVRFPATGPEGWSSIVRQVTLAAGSNRLVIDEGDHVLFIDCIDLFPAETEPRMP